MVRIQQRRHGQAVPQSCDGSCKIYNRPEAKNQADIVGWHVQEIKPRHNKRSVYCTHCVLTLNVNDESRRNLKRAW